MTDKDMVFRLKKKQLKVLKSAIEHYGEDHQIMKASEECGELIEVIDIFMKEKNIFYDNINFLNRCEETADVIITAMQLYLMNPGTVQGFIDAKIERLKKRIEDEKSVHQGKVREEYREENEII